MNDKFNRITKPILFLIPIILSAHYKIESWFLHGINLSSSNNLSYLNIKITCEVFYIY